VLRLTADWPVDWLRGSGIRTMEIQRQLLHGEILELPSVPKRRSLPAETKFRSPKFHRDDQDRHDRCTKDHVVLDGPYEHAKEPESNPS
jgi:hypothetical protein